MFLQLKQDILSGRLIPPPQISVQLSALALQCEFGIYLWILNNLDSLSWKKMISIFVAKAKIY